jgi:3',5'-cyclic AMP phosphodiesterase CpdA
MRTIAHLSDLHFGTEDPLLAETVKSDLHALKPDLVVVSGDFTQRARRAQFAAARDYLQLLPGPQLLIPGNHDIPFYDVWRRFVHPLARYQEFIHNEVNPVYQDEELLVVGLNTARSSTWKNGRISVEQMELLRRALDGARPGVFRIVVTHHPFVPPPGQTGADIALVGRAARALEVLDRGRVDLLLAGHLHLGYTADTHTLYPEAARAIIVAQAGTAISRRLRSAPNAYNVMRTGEGHLSIEARAWDGRAFAAVSTSRFLLQEGNWVREGE